MGTKLTFAVDYDGTITDTNNEKVKWIRTNLGLKIPPWQCNRTDCIPIIGASAYARMTDYVYEAESTLRTEEVPGAAGALQAISAVGDVYVVTARTPRRIAYAEEWLCRNNISSHVKDVLTSDHSSKAAVCRDIGATVLIDDDARHLDVPDLDWLTRVLLHHGRTELPLLGAGVVFCGSWQAVLRLFKLKTHEAS
jgi:5'(3')-deoxyribonucleotidase